MGSIVQELMLCRSKSTPSLCLWPVNAVMDWESHSSHFQKTQKRPTFITSASKMQVDDWEQGLLGHIHATSPTPLWLLCSLHSFPSSRREVSMDTWTSHSQICMFHRAPRRHGTREVFRGGKQQKFALEVASWKWGKFPSQCTDVPLLWRMKSKENAIAERSAILTFLLLLHCLSNLLAFSTPSTLSSAL